jgi:DNA-binding NarL/FixJ family response regulator
MRCCALHSNLALSESAIFLDTGWLSGDARVVVSGSVQDLVPARRKHFSPRQSQILSLMAEGFSDKEIARKIGISYPTVRTHLDRIFRDYRVRNRTEAVAVWLNMPRVNG